MKIARMMEILTILLNRKTVTASELAQRFDVSVRTIYRDIDVLSSSGIPIYTSQGSGGGISILDEYTMNSAMLSDTEKNSIMFALQTLRTTKYPDADCVLEKLKSLFKTDGSEWISVDLTRWGANPNARERFNIIKKAIIHGRVIEIEYINADNCVSIRRVEPMKLMFKSQAWYLFAYCLNKKNYRTFRITRIKRVEVTDTIFDRTVIHQTDGKIDLPESKPTLTHIVLQFTPDALYRLYDDYEPEDLQINPDGTYTLEVDFPEDEWVYGYIMSFSTSVKVLEPQHIRDLIGERCRKICEYYTEKVNGAN
jgi:predicted DNA-binding transcriptional regulator YafY